MHKRLKKIINIINVNAKLFKSKATKNKVFKQQLDIVINKQRKTYNKKIIISKKIKVGKFKKFRDKRKKLCLFLIKVRRYI